MRRWQRELDGLVQSRHHVLLAYAQLLTGQRANAEDLVQEALVATYSSGRHLPGTEAAEAYVRRAIASRFIDEKRRSVRQRRLATDLQVVTGSEIAGPEQDVVLRTDLARALQELSPRERACVVLRYLERLSTAETAHALGIAEGTVKRYVSDGVKRLNELLGTEADPRREMPAVPVEGRHSHGG
ncbi:RNA polymerase sigma factor [Demequina aestuarii]|uniref:RNA polymerase sigma factor n=1 Tax=Demequina aestuarii TaxID=327095 RepID=UPI0007835148|nr:sigma-70 family RNA polymerase sigma factor [Demequina aestuarii]